MIRSLDDAWKWYSAVKALAQDMKRMAEKWNTAELQAVVSRDNRLRDRAAGELMDRANATLDDLNDLAVLLMFSVFEATVRDHAKADVDRETASIQHPAVLRAVKDLKEAIENGSFGRVTESYKSMDVDLTEQVNQVRKYRNWVAHGRRGEPENSVVADIAIERLRRYLARLAKVEGAAAALSPSAVSESPLASESEGPPGV